MKKGIVLGLFHTESFHNYADKKENSAYPFRKNNVTSEEEVFTADNIISVVTFALKNCDICYFILDGLEIPINLDREGFTNKELKLIINCEKFSDKTIFVRGNYTYDLEDVLKLIKQ